MAQKTYSSTEELKGLPSQLAETAQHTEAIHGESALFDWVSKVFKVDSKPGPVHTYLAGLPALLGNSRQLIVTPKYDTALGKAFRDAKEDFDVAVYVAPRTAQAGVFCHLAWEDFPFVKPVDKPNEYTGFPIVAEDRTLLRTIIVRINGTIDDRSAGFNWDENYVITEDHYIDYLSGRSAEEAIPAQLLAKLKKTNYLFSRVHDL